MQKKKQSFFVTFTNIFPVSYFLFTATKMCDENEAPNAGDDNIFNRSQ